MERAVKRDHMFAPSMNTGQLKRGFDRLRAGVRKEDSFRCVARRKLSQLLREIGERPIVEIRPAHMQ